MNDKLQILLAMAGYMLIVILLGVYFAKQVPAKFRKLLFGRPLPRPWVACHERRGLGHERLAANGAAGRGLLVWPG